MEKIADAAATANNLPVAELAAALAELLAPVAAELPDERLRRLFLLVPLAAMDRAVHEKLDDGYYYGEIHGIWGVYAHDVDAGRDAT